MTRFATLLIISALTTTLNAQEPIVIVQSLEVINPPLYNRFAMDVQFGTNYATAPLADGYNVPTMNLFHVGLGGRYMLNPKFGLRLGVNYDQLNDTEGSPEFRTDYYRTSLEGVINLGKLLSFEDWTRTFGLLLHAGAGYSAMMDPSNTGLGTDHMLNVVGGITPQFKIGDRWNINVDVTMVSNADQEFTYDMTQRYSSRGLTGYLYTYSIGLQYNFGKKGRYADWVVMPDRTATLESRIAQLERNQMDDDGDGVVNHLDIEPNTPYGTMVDTKGRTMIWYTVYEEVSAPDYTSTPNFARYVNAYNVLFETDKAEIAPRYNRTLDNIALAMTTNTAYQLTVVGHADDRGEAAYNMDLSKRRAEAVKAYLVAKGVSAARITATAVGETQPLTDENTPEGLHADRRVQFILK